MPRIWAEVINGRTIITTTIGSSSRDGKGGTLLTAGKASKRTQPIIVISVVSVSVPKMAHLPEGGVVAQDVRVMWGGSDMARAREMARKHGGVVFAREDGGTRYQPA